MKFSIYLDRRVFVMVHNSCITRQKTLRRMNFSVRMSGSLARCMSSSSSQVSLVLPLTCAYIIGSGENGGCAGSPEHLLFAYAIMVLFPEYMKISLGKSDKQTSALARLEGNSSCI